MYQDQHALVRLPKPPRQPGPGLQPERGNRALRDAPGLATL